MSQKNQVMVWEEKIIIPTYKVHEPEKNPMFLENRVYQGSSGKVYPLPVTEKISDTKEDVEYTAVFLENEYLKIMVLPELGGRIQRAFDKTNGYDFVYYNQVIKPALVGLTGPWISGGIEFNWPQHHRPSTFNPVDYTFSQNKDGSATIRVSEIDKMYGTKGMGCFTLYPDTAVIEIKGQLYNNTDMPQTFLWWANPAVPVNDYTYSVFPPDVHAVMDHGKRAVSTFPIATGEYYKYDYSDGVDISMYKNVKVPTSYMAAHSDFDFIGNYDENKKAGLLHVADHHISPGKKQWTWGNADFGKAWDANLTDEDGPYIELMTGVFADNQPDFTWLKPYEEKSFVQYFMPYKGVGRVKNATKDAMINFDVKDGVASISVYTTTSHNDLEVVISFKKKEVYKKNIETSPNSYFSDSFATDSESAVGFEVLVLNNHGKVLVSYTAAEQKIEPVPSPAKELAKPQDLKTTEELFLGAQHLEQYRHATYEPADYYEEGLKRDASDLRLNNGYGLLLFKRGDFTKAKFHFQKAVEKQIWKNPNPYYGECYFNLGLVNFYLGEIEDAYEAFYKATWSFETQGAGFYWLAIISSKNKQYGEALEFINKALIFNWHNMKARVLKITLMRTLGMDTSSLIEESLNIDPLFMGCTYEAKFVQKGTDSNEWVGMMREDAHNYLVLSLDYLRAGFIDDAIFILESCPAKNPLINYYKGYANACANRNDAAIECFSAAEGMNPDYCFPNKLDEIIILSKAVELLKAAPQAHYYLGNIYYDKKQYGAAIKHWEDAVAEGSTYSIVYRNLALAHYKCSRNEALAMSYMAKGLELDMGSHRLLLEYDQLRKRCNAPLTERLELLKAKLELVKERDVLLLEYVTLLNLMGEYDDALTLLKAHTYHPWEGGEGKVSSQYRYALLKKAETKMCSGEYDEAIEFLKKTLTFPENLGEGKLPNTPDNIAHYYLGLCFKALSEVQKANEYFMLATMGPTDPCIALYYHDQPSDIMLYQGLAHAELGNETDAKRVFYKMKSFGERHIFDSFEHDYFAVSLPELDIFPEDMQLKNELYCEYLISLSMIGLKSYDEAEKKLKLICDKQPHHQGALQHLSFLLVFDKIKKNR